MDKEPNLPPLIYSSDSRDVSVSKRNRAPDKQLTLPNAEMGAPSSARLAVKPSILT